MTREELIKQIHAKQSFLCVGLDTDINKIPQHLLQADDPIFEFNKAIIDATAPYCVAYKPNLAFYESLGVKGLLAFERTVAYLNENYPEQFVIADAKRGDIGATARQYAREAFERYGADAVTLSPFMGFDSIEPYLDYADKGLFLLCRTSNPGGDDLQALPLALPGQPRLFEHLAQLAQGPWNVNGQLGLVVGATRAHEVARVREIAPALPLLIPGVGAQGGDAAATVRAGWRPGGPVVINSSRAILYASSGANFADAARAAALATRAQLQAALPAGAVL